MVRLDMARNVETFMQAVLRFMAVLVAVVKDEIIQDRLTPLMVQARQVPVHRLRLQILSQAALIKIKKRSLTGLKSQSSESKERSTISIKQRRMFIRRLRAPV